MVLSFTPVGVVILFSPVRTVPVRARWRHAPFARSLCFVRACGRLYSVRAVFSAIVTGRGKLASFSLSFVTFVIVTDRGKLTPISLSFCFVFGPTGPRASRRIPLHRVLLSRPPCKRITCTEAVVYLRFAASRVIVVIVDVSSVYFIARLLLHRVPTCPCRSPRAPGPLLDLLLRRRRCLLMAPVPGALATITFRRRGHGRSDVIRHEVFAAASLFSATAQLFQCPSWRPTRSRTFLVLQPAVSRRSATQRFYHLLRAPCPRLRPFPSTPTCTTTCTAASTHADPVPSFRTGPRQERHSPARFASSQSLLVLSAFLTGSPHLARTPTKPGQLSQLCSASKPPCPAYSP